MNKQRTQYKLVGRYVKWNDTVYYAIKSDEGKKLRCNEDQMAYIVGRGQVSNIKAQLYKDKVLLRGVDFNISSLPTVQLDKTDETAKPVAKTAAKPVAKKQQTDKENNTNIKDGKLPEAIIEGLKQCLPPDVYDGSIDTYQEALKHIVNRVEDIEPDVDPDIDKFSEY